MVSNPIDIRTGNKYEEHHDLSLPSVSGKPPLNFSRYYNSQSNNISALGYGWTHNYSAHLAYITDDGNYPYLKIVDETGRGYYFPNKIQSYWNNAFHEKTKVLEETDGYTWFREDGSQYRFDVAGKLIWIEDPAGNRHTLSYDVSGRIESITDDSSGRSLTFHYTASNLLDHISGPVTPSIQDGIWISYDYDANSNLTSVTYADGSGFNLEYNDPADPHNLTAKKDKLNHTIATWGYDSQDRAYQSTTRDGRGVTINYASSDTVEVTDAYGVTKTYGITKFEGIYPEVTSITGPGGCQSCAGDQPIRYAYDEQLNVTEEEYANGTINQFQDYDERGNPGTVILAAGTTEENTITYTYHPEINHPLTMTKTSVLGIGYKVTIWDYDNDGNTIPNEAPTRQVSRIIEQGYTTDSQGAIVPYEYITAYQYNANGQVVSIDGPLAGTQDLTTLSYDPATGDLLSVTQPVVGTISFDNYDGAGNPGQETDLNSQVTTLTYDGRNRLLSGTMNGVSSSRTYNTAGDLETVTDRSGRTSSFTYDTVHGLLERITDISGNYLYYGYDAQGNRVEDSSYDAADVRHRWQRFDYHNPVNPGKLWKIINPNDSATVFEYDAMDNVNQITDPNTKVTQYQYDALDRVSLISQPGPTNTQFTYNSVSGVTGVQDAAGKLTSYDYDDLGRKVAENSPDSGITTYEYDAAGNLTSKTDAKGISVAYTYDALNRLTAETYPDSSQNVTYTYDQGTYGVGRLTGRTDQSGSYTYTYDAFGNLVEEQKTVGGVVYATTYTYDQSGVLTGVGYPEGFSVQYTLDADGRVQAVTWNKEGETPVTLASGIVYMPFGPMSHMVLGSGISVDLSYDQSYQLTELAHGSTLDLTYSRDNDGNVTAITDNLDPNKSKTFGYDDLYRLTSATGPFGTISYTYDAVGNRLTRTSNQGVNEAYEYVSGTNRLKKVSGSLYKRYGYDESGKPSVIAGDIVTPVPNTDYIANAESERIIKNVNSATTVFHYDLNGNLIAETDATGALTKAYVYVGTLRLATIEVSQGAVSGIYYHHNDQLGTPQRLTDGTGTVVWSADYDPFGKATVTTATVTNNFRLPGQYYDSETGFHYNWHRYYDPQTGRYMRPDPIGLEGGINLFGYVQQNPVNFIDPMGLNPGDYDNPYNPFQIVDGVGGPRRFSPTIRNNAYKDSPNCAYCGTKLDPKPGKPNSYEADHYVPYSKGGQSTDSNCVPSCRSCNRSKGDKMPGEWMGGGGGGWGPTIKGIEHVEPID